MSDIRGQSQSACVSSCPPSPFPRWLCVLFPRLRAAETNGIYQAFRERRLYHHRRRFVFEMRMVAPIVAICSFLMMPLLAILDDPLQNAGIHLPTIKLVLFLGIVSMVALLLSFAPLLLPSTRFQSRQYPDRLGGILRMFDVLDEQIRGLWLAGVRPCEMAECLYLEMWEYLLRRLYTLAPFIILGIPAWFLVKHHSMGLPAWIIAAGWLLLMITLLVDLVAVIEHCACCKIENIVGVFRKGLSPLRSFALGLLATLLLGLMTIGMLWIFAKLISLLEEAAPWNPSMAENIQDWTALLEKQLIVAGAGLLLGYWLYRAGRHWSGVAMIQFEKKFEPFMRKVIMDDPDWERPCNEVAP